MSVIEHYKQTLADLDENGKIDFMLRTSRLASLYQEYNAQTPEADAKAVRPAFTKRSKWNGTTRVNNTKILERIKTEYFRAAGVGIPVMKMEDEKAKALEETTCCATPDIIMLIEHAICAACGRKVKDSTQFVNNVSDTSLSANRLVTLTKATDTVSVLNKTGLVSKALLRFQGLVMSGYKEASWKRLYADVTRGVEDVSSISCAMISRRLQVTDKAYKEKYSKDMHIIWERITGHPLHLVPDAVLWLIYHRIANQLVVPMVSSISATPSKEPRIIAMMLLYKCFQLCGEKELMQLIVMQHRDAIMTKFDPIWRKTCETHNLRYMC